MTATRVRPSIIVASASCALAWAALGCDPGEARAPTTGSVTRTPRDECAFTPENAYSSRETLECFCRSRQCPPDLGGGLSFFSSLGAKDRTLAISRYDGCGLVELGASSGHLGYTLIYEASSRALVGGRYSGELCPKETPCAIVAGQNPCPARGADFD